MHKAINNVTLRLSKLAAMTYCQTTTWHVFIFQLILLKLYFLTRPLEDSEGSDSGCSLLPERDKAECAKPSNNPHPSPPQSRGIQTAALVSLCGSNDPLRHHSLMSCRQPKCSRYHVFLYTHAPQTSPSYLFLLVKPTFSHSLRLRTSYALLHV